MKSNILRQVSAGLFGVGLLAALPANAAIDTKIYPGSMCKPATSALSYTVTGSTSYSSFTQNYPGRTGVACPIVRDEWGKTTPAAAYVNVYDPDTNDYVWCALYSSNSTAGTISYNSAISDTAFKGNTMLIMSTSTGTNYLDTLTMVCNLNQNAKIYSYDIDEAIQID